MIPIMIYGFYLNYDLRRMVVASLPQVRANTNDHTKEDPFAGAVRIWVESILVFCRLAELVGRVFTK